MTTVGTFMTGDVTKLANAWPRQPFVGLALAAGLGILWADFTPNASPVVLSVIAMFGMILLIWRSSAGAYVFVAASFFYLHSLCLVDTPGLRLAQELGEQPQNITVRGVVMSEPKVSANGVASFLLELESFALNSGLRPSHATLFVRWKGIAGFGDELQLFGIAGPVRPPRNPGEFDMRSYLARHDVHRQLYVGYEGDGKVLHHRAGNPILRAAQTSRRWMQNVLSRGLEDSPRAEGLINGMVLGVRRQTPEDIEEPFQQTGTLHLFSVSGLHVAIVAQLLWIIATVARVRRKWAIAFIIPALFFYATTTGLQAASVRAALMTAVLLCGVLVERRVFTLNTLAAAAVLILSWNTNELFSVGFQLSFSVVAAIVLLAEPIYRLIRRCFEADPFLPRALFSSSRRVMDRLLRWTARAASVSLAAWIGSLPLMVWYYNIVTPISLFANLIVIPMAFFILAGGLLSMIAAPVSSWVSIIFNNANWILAEAVLGVVHFFAQLPAGHFYVERPRWATAARAEVTVLDLGTGGAAHVRARRRDWLFDAGGQRDFERVVQPYLRSRGINRLDGILLSHGDSAHIGGAAAGLEDFRARQIIDSEARDRSRIHRALIRQLADHKIDRKLRVAGDEMTFSSNVKAKILFPPAGFEAKSADDQTLVVQLLIDEQPGILFVSDSGAATERMLLQTQIDLRSDIMVKGQHRFGVSGSAEFLDAVRPQAIIATSRNFPNSERITEEWTALVQSRGIKLFRQDETGAVSLKFFRHHWEATSYLTSETFRSTSR